MKGYIYEIRNKNTNKVYIGSAIDITRRWNTHRNELTQNKHHNIYLQRAWDKYGDEAFEWNIIEEVEDGLLEREQWFLDNKSNKYNIGRVACGGDNLTNHPDKKDIIERRKISQRTFFDNLTTEEKKKIYGRNKENNGMWGQTHTDKVKNKLRKNAQQRYDDGESWAMYREGKTNIEMYGEEVAGIISKKLSIVGKLRVGKKNPFYGKHHTEETKRTLREKREQRLDCMTVEDKKNHRQIRFVEIENIVYHGVAEAARQLGVTPGTICYRIKSSNPKFINYKYIDKAKVSV